MGTMRGYGIWMALCFLCGLLLAAGLVMGILGAKEYPPEKRWKDVALQSAVPCLVLEWEVVERLCKDDDGAHDCSYAAWHVLYFTQPTTDTPSYNETAIIKDNKDGKQSKAQERAQLHPVGSSATCYYDSTSLKYARWTVPNTSRALGLLISGWILFGISAISFCLGLWLMLRKGDDFIASIGSALPANRNEAEMPMLHAKPNPNLPGGNSP